MKKYILNFLAFILIFAMALPTQNASAAQVFTDVPTNHGNYKDIMYLLDQGVISADKKTFGVQDIVTREEVAVMVAKAVKLDGTTRTTKFSDVPKSNPNSGYIQSAVEAGIINGYDDGTFKPTEPEGDVNSGTYVIPGAPTSFKNCDEMREYYPNGVSSSHPAYAPARDGDKDGWACEK